MPGCGDSGPGFERYVSTAPTPQQLIGVWRPLAQSLRDFQRKTSFTIVEPHRHELELQPSGECRFRTHWQYSYVDADDPETSSYFDTARCSWKLGTSATRVGDVTFEAPAVLIYVQQHSREAHTLYFIAEQNRRLILWQSIAEPDWGYYMDFALAHKQ